MKDNEINRAKCGCALEPSGLNIQVHVSSLPSRDLRAQLAPIKRHPNRGESCGSAAQGLPEHPAQGEGGDLHLCRASTSQM